jgi:hypothetical protein
MGGILWVIPCISLRPIRGLADSSLKAVSPLAGRMWVIPHLSMCYIVDSRFKRGENNLQKNLPEGKQGINGVDRNHKVNYHEVHRQVARSN